MFLITGVSARKKIVALEERHFVIEWPAICYCLPIIVSKKGGPKCDFQKKIVAWPTIVKEAQSRVASVVSLSGGGEKALLAVTLSPLRPKTPPPV